jgi:predicted nucleic acid-binding protein
VRLFLDSSVMIAGAASAEGASRSVFRLARTQEWRLVTTPYAVEETVRNLVAFPPSVTASWLRLRSQLVVVDDVVTIDKPAVFPVEKDRPILFSALASTDVLLTLDRADFSRLLGDRFYGLAVMTPGMWLSREREAGRLGRV